MIKSCTPQSDMDCYINGHWKKMKRLNNIVETNNFLIIQDRLDREIEKMVWETFINSSIDAFKKSYYAPKNYTNLRKIINSIKEMETVTDLANLVSYLTRCGINTFFDLNVGVHYRDPKVYTLGIREYDLTLEIPENYKESEKIIRFKRLLCMTCNFLDKVCDVHVDRGTFIDSVLIFESMMSKLNMKMEDYLDPYIISNSISYREFLEIYDCHDFWKTVFEPIGLPKEIIITFENKKFIEFIPKLIDFFKENGLLIIKNQLIWKVIKYFGIHTKFAEYILDVIPSGLEKKEVFINTIYTFFGQDIEDIIIKKKLTPEIDQDISTIFAKLKSDCIQRISRTPIFEESTIKGCLKKLESLDVVIGKQEKRFDLITTYPTLLENDLFFNLISLEQNLFSHRMRNIGQPTNRKFLNYNSEVFTFHVNAYYDPLTNMIYIPYGILQEPFYSINYSLERKYGGIGAIIGHEMMHSFDVAGSKYDDRGVLRDWWTDSDRKRYNLETDKIRRHYLKLLGLGKDKMDIDKMTMGENMADILGLKVAYNSLSELIKGKEKEIQREMLKIFFYTWAIIFRSAYRPEVVEILKKQDVHSQAGVRINGPLAHINEYYELFHVKSSDANYLHYEDRCKFMD